MGVDGEPDEEELDIGVGACSGERGAEDDVGKEVAMESKGTSVEVGEGCESNELFSVDVKMEVAFGAILVIVV